MPFLEAVALSHRFHDGSWGLRHISLQIDPGQLVVITGHNGAGKTLLARHLVGLIEPTEGNMLLQGHDLSRVAPEKRSQVGLVFQNAENQVVGQTVAEDVAFGPNNLSLEERQRHQRVEDALQAMNLKHLATREPRTLSGGEMRRLAIAGVVAMNPQILIIDEPFSSLDEPNRTAVNACLRGLQLAGCGVVIITHDIDRVTLPIDRTITLHHGCVVANLLA